MFRLFLTFLRTREGRDRIGYYLGLLICFDFHTILAHFRRVRDLIARVANPQINSKFLISVLQNSVEQFWDSKLNIQKSEGHKAVTVLIPAYGNANLIKLLLEDLSGQSIKFKCILIDDCSVEKGFENFLQQILNQYSEWLSILRNEENLGFVGTVNRGLKIATGHVVLLNSDVRIPPNFVEEIIRPFDLYSDIASVTPMTNSGSIASIPTQILDHDILPFKMEENLCLAIGALAGSYSKNFPYQYTPTGVGFALALNRHALNLVGNLDSDFSPAYGEEVDWCQRAHEFGFQSILHLGLFVWHQHGASYSDQKVDLINSHNQKISIKYPKYDLQVANFIQDNKIGEYRVALALLISIFNRNVGVTFSHGKGGGSALWKAEENSPTCDVVVSASAKVGEFRILITLWGDDFECTVNHEELWVFLKLLHPAQIEIGSIAILGAENHSLFLEELSSYLEMNKEAKKSFVVHDYFALCPSYNLLNEKNRFCNIPDLETCANCLKANNAVNNKDKQISIQRWREINSKLVSNVSSIKVLSETSEALLRRGLELSNPTFHQIDPYSRLAALGASQKRIIGDTELHHGAARVRILTLGNLNVSKGLLIVKHLADYAFNNSLPFDFYHLGSSYRHSNINIKYMGQYERLELRDKLASINPDLVLIPSIWPETYCFTAEEAWQLGYNVATSNLGALGERFKDRQNTLIFDSVEDLENEKFFFQEVSNFLKKSPKAIYIPKETES